MIASKIFAMKIQTPENHTEKKPGVHSGLRGTILTSEVFSLRSQRGYSEELSLSDEETAAPSVVRGLSSVAFKFSPLGLLLVAC